MYQCGLPKPMALELFKPFVIKRLVDLNYAQNMKSRQASCGPRRRRSVRRARRSSPSTVLLNRAPTLHRLGIQAFEPISVEGKAHPPAAAGLRRLQRRLRMVTQMAVHLLSAEARPSPLADDGFRNILEAGRRPTVTMPSEDMILGLYYLSTVLEGVKERAACSPRWKRPKWPLDRHEIDMQAKVLIRLPESFVLPKNWEPGRSQGARPARRGRGRQGRTLPRRHRAVRHLLRPHPVHRDPADRLPVRQRAGGLGRLSKIVDDIAMRYSTQQVAATLDALRISGFTRAPWSGVSFAFSDVNEPPERDEEDRPSTRPRPTRSTPTHDGSVDEEASPSGTHRPGPGDWTPEVAKEVERSSTRPQTAIITCSLVHEAT